METINRNECALRVVLIGGSAGSLPAFQSLLEVLPAQTGAAYVVIQHRTPGRGDLLGGLLAARCRLPVEHAHAGVALMPDRVYVGIPGEFTSVSGGEFRLEHPDPGERHRPIDFLGRSLARSYGARASLVILSGTGRDGTAAAAEIKQAGGVVLVQEPASAGFDGMPASVIGAGLADRIQPPHRLAATLAVWAGEGGLPPVDSTPRAEDTREEAFASILERVREHAHQDMGGYKPSTLRRRIERRMALRRMPDLAAYAELLGRERGELDQLAQDLLIGVTTFFRDEEAFELLEREVIGPLCADKGADETVRVWVAGCSTGEEAYSVAILLLEWFEAHGQTPRVQVFATDIDDAALAVARAGVYGTGALEGVSAQRRRRFFSEEPAGFRIAKAVRESIVFASHNLISDPPFSKLDLVVCRNLLIYLEGATQKKVLSLFRFVLNPGGFLFLGSSESLGQESRHFHTVSKQWRLFRHKADAAPRRPPPLPIGPMGAVRRSALPGEPEAAFAGVAGRERFYRQLLERYGPTLMLVDARDELLFVAGDTSCYLAVPTGQASQDLFKLVKPALAMALRSAVNRARKEQVRSSVRALGTEGELAGVRIEVTPISAAEQQLLLVGLSTEAPGEAALPMAGAEGEDWVLQQLVQELNATREDLHRTIEQSRVSADEMKAAHEEVVAMNEELQSSNEELESSKEELQSLNEELTSANATLDAKVTEVETLNADLGNLLNATETATLLLDEELRIRRFTPACEQLLRIIPGDLGRPLDDVVRRFEDPQLSADCQRAARGESVPDQEVGVGEEHWYLRRLLPYRDGEGRLAGAVLTFPEITSIKRAEAMLREKARTLEWQANLLSQSAPVLGRDLDDRIVFWNRGAEALYGWSEAEALGKVSHELLHTRFPEPLERIKSVVTAKGVWEGELSHRNREGAILAVDSRWTAYRNDTGVIEAIVEVNNDITERKQVQDALRTSEEVFHTMVDWTYNWEYWVHNDGSIIYMTPSAERITGFGAKEFQEDPELLTRIVHEDDRYLWQRHRSGYLGDDGSNEPAQIEYRIVRKGGEIRWVEHTCRPVLLDGERPRGRRVTVRDVTAQKNAEERIRTLAYFDPLTHLPNRRLLLDRLGQALLTGKRSHQYGALLMLDLDQFKSINDTRGHDVGDRLLRELSERLVAGVRHQDTVARLGGDEFAVMLEDLGTAEAQAAGKAEDIAEKLRRLIETPFRIAGEIDDYRATASVGITLFDGNRESAAVLLKQAEVALYQAKDAGRNAIRFFSPAMQLAVDTRTALEGELRRGFENNELRLFLQPQVDRRGRVIGAEVLIRWISPDRGIVSPGEFIPLAEQTGLILPIGQWVIEQACVQLKKWAQDPRTRQLTLSVNVSPRQFHQPDFVERVRESVRSSGIDPGLLKLELTESVVLDGIDEALGCMGQLLALGVSFSLDDFGTGYSALAYLKQLPLSQVKIDQSFVRDLADDPSDAAIVGGILAMNQSLGLTTVAEGVETQAQYEFLLEHGCAVFQGFLFGKPMPIEEWSEVLDTYGHVLE